MKQKQSILIESGQVDHKKLLIQMNIYEKIVTEIKASSNIVITSHKSPDGDSVGSSLGLLYFIEKLGKKASVCHPDAAPEFLSWLNPSSFLLMTDQPEEVATAFKEADLVFCLDYNATNRIGPEMQAVLEGASCKTIMIDHHLNPEHFSNLMVSETSASSTSELIV